MSLEALLSEWGNAFHSDSAWRVALLKAVVLSHPSEQTVRMTGKTLSVFVRHVIPRRLYLSPLSHGDDFLWDIYLEDILSPGKGTGCRNHPACGTAVGHLRSPWLAQLCPPVPGPLWELFSH